MVPLYAIAVGVRGRTLTSNPIERMADWRRSDSPPRAPHGGVQFSSAASA